MTTNDNRLVAENVINEANDLINSAVQLLCFNGLDYDHSGLTEEEKLVVECATNKLSEIVKQLDNIVHTKFEFQGNYDAQMVRDLLEPAQKQGVVSQYHESRGNIVWFWGRHSPEIRELADEIKSIVDTGIEYRDGRWRMKVPNP